MVETRSGVGAGAQTSFWTIAMLAMTVGIGLMQDAGDNTNQLIAGAAVFLGAVAIVFAKYFFKLPDVSEKDMQDTIAIMAGTYEDLVKIAAKIYNEDVHAFRDEVVKHRALIKASAAMLPAKWQVYLNGVLDNLDQKYKVPN